MSQAPRRTKVIHKSFNGDILRAKQDLQNHDIWYLELFHAGECKSVMRLKVTADNCNALFKLLKLEKPKPAENWYKRYMGKGQPDVFYKKILQGGRTY